MRIVITGVGVVSTLGINIDTFWKNMISGGIPGFRPITRFDTMNYRCKLAGEIEKIDPQKFGILKGAKTYDRIQLFASGAAKSAWESAAFGSKYYSSDDMGVVFGSTYGYIDSASNFYLESLKEGPLYVSPIAFANTVMNAPAGRIAIHYNITGLCSTIASGETSGLDVISYACNFIRAGKCKAILAGAGSVLCEGIFMGFYYNNLLSGSKEGTPEHCAPFDKKANGIILGEGAAMVAIEELEQAKARGATILAEIKGMGSRFVPTMDDTNAIIESRAAAMKESIISAGLEPGDISMISACANSNLRTDRIEAQAIKSIFGNCAEKIPITAIKSMTGECLDASAAMQIVASVCSIRDGKIPPIHAFENPADDSGLRYASRSMDAPINSVLINSYSCYGKSNSLVIGVYNE